MGLYSLTSNYLTMKERLRDPGYDQVAVKDTLNAIFGEFEDKAEDCARLINDTRGEVETIRKEIERLSTRKKALENKIERIKQHLQTCMDAMGKPRFKTALFSFGIQNNPYSVDIDNEAGLPEKYLIAQPAKVDRKALIEDLKAGNKISGCRLTQTQGLRIR